MQSRAKVMVGHADVPTPAFVRYAWASNPQSTLYNKEVLPASPFQIAVGK